MIRLDFISMTTLRTVMLSLVCSLSPVMATDMMLCAGPTIQETLVRDQGKYNIVFTLENDTESAISIEPFYFGENMLNLSATDRNGKALMSAVPLLNPGVDRISILPDHKFVRRVELDRFFPGLEAAVKMGKVHLAWQLTLRGEESCSTQIINTTMTIVAKDK